MASRKKRVASGGNGKKRRRVKVEDSDDEEKDESFMQQQYGQQQQQLYAHQQQYAPVASTSALSPMPGDAGQQQQQQFMQYQQGEGPEQLTDEERLLAAQYSTVSQIEATPYTDPETGEATYPCPFCEKTYGGKHGRSIWRRHLCNKHGIPLHIQPRRTRWDNDTNRPKDEAERHKRTLESKRRWAAKNRADKQKKRKGGDDIGFDNDGLSREGSSAPYGYDGNDNSNNSSFGCQYDETEQSFMAHAIAQEQAAAAQQHYHPHQQQHPSQLRPPTWQATPAGQHYYSGPPAPPSSTGSSGSASSSYPHLQQGGYSQQQPSLSPNFIPYERVPLARQNSAPPARQSQPQSTSTRQPSPIPILHAPRPQLVPHWSFNEPILSQPAPSSSLAVPPMMQRSLSAPLMHMLPHQVDQHHTSRNLILQQSQQHPSPQHQQQQHLDPAQAIFTQPPKQETNLFATNFDLEANLSSSIPTYQFSMSSSYQLQPPRPEFARSSSALTVVADAQVQQRPRATSASAPASQTTSTKATSTPRSKRASTPVKKIVQATLKKQDSKAEAALQLLALKTSSSSPPPSPAAALPALRTLPASEMDAEGESELDLSIGQESFADSGYGPIHDSDDEEEEDRRKDSKRTEKTAEHILALELPSSPGRLSLSPSPSPPPPTKSRALASSALEKKTPTKKRVRRTSENDENDGYPQRISLDSSPEGEPLPARRRLLTSSPVSRHSQTASSGGPTSNSCGTLSSSHLTTPYPNIWSIRNTKQNSTSASNIFNMDNTGRPSAGLGMVPSSPAHFLLSSPEHAAISRSLGLVPESHHPTAFDYQFLRGYDGVQEYAQGVFGGPPSER